MRPARTLLTAVVVLTLALALSATPIAAMPDGDGLLGGDDSGVDIGTDGIGVGGDDGVNVGTDGVSVGGDEGANVSTDGVSVAGQDVGTDGNLGDGDLTDVGGEGVTGSLDAVGDTDGLAVLDSSGQLLAAPGPGDGAPNVSEVVGPEGIVDTEDSDVNASRIDILGPLPNTGENTEALEDALTVSSEDLPVSGEQLPADALPTDQAPGPEALPVGSDSQIDCAKPIEADDLPAGAVPYIDDLPVQPPTVPLLPTRVASPENVAGLAFSFAPDTCEIYDPDNPSIDPTDPPTNPTFEYRTASISSSNESAGYYGLTSGELSEGGAGWDGFLVFQLTGERVALVEEFTVTDGQTENYAGVESDTRVRRDLSESRGQYTVYVPGAGGLQTGFECGNIPEHEVDPLEEPTATCEIDQPIPEIVTPEKVVDVIQNPPQYDLPEIEGEKLPIDV